MARKPELPTTDQVLDLARGFGLAMTRDRADAYRGMMSGMLTALAKLDDYAEPKPAVKYPRTPGYRPLPADNPYNAWYWRCEVKGSAEGPLAGERIGLKDVIALAGVPMMNGSRLLEGFIPDTDATVATRLLDAGAVIVGKTASSDFSFSSGGHTSAYGPIRNPRKPTHSPGGSSKGSAAAIAAGDIRMALGGDQGGSIRIPAAWCGVVGLKQTYGLVPYTGCMSIDPTMDHIGPMADTVENVARLLSVVAGPDPLDPRQRGVIPSDYVRDYLPAVGAGVEGLRIGLVREGFEQTEETWPEFRFPGSETVVDEKVRAAAEALGRVGATVGEVSVPMHYDGLRIAYAILVEGASEHMLKGYGAGVGWLGYYDVPMMTALSRGLKSQPNDLPGTVINIMLLGEYLHRDHHGRYYAKAQNLRGVLRQAYDAALERYDVLIMPTIPRRSQPIPPPDCPFEDYMGNALNMLNNVPQFNATGHPAISVPCGVQDDLPIGAMVIGRHFDDLTVLRVADAIEKRGDWRTL